ncbi:hypothetical protein AVEN_152326-1 [Araneus ventricosus]|uniref:Uncharacterized protein n=1 Tax=Araneus ventricosus TaxID=182803 RepID=A0A4Y2FU73_ARAVE|nr:hypothetical protein AVEN_152326-1 [Araneus ventricosus]
MKRKTYKHFYAVIRIGERFSTTSFRKAALKLPYFAIRFNDKEFNCCRKRTTCEQVYCKAYHQESVTVNQVIKRGESRGEKTRICRLRLQNSNQEKAGCSHFQGDRKRRNNPVLRKSE